MDKKVKFRILGALLLLLASVLLTSMPLTSIAMAFASVACICTCDKTNRKLMTWAMIVLIVFVSLDFVFSIVRISANTLHSYYYYYSNRYGYNYEIISYANFFAIYAQADFLISMVLLAVAIKTEKKPFYYVALGVMCEFVLLRLFVCFVDIRLSRVNFISSYSMLTRLLENVFEGAVFILSIIFLAKGSLQTKARNGVVLETVVYSDLDNTKPQKLGVVEEVTFDSSDSANN